MDPVDILIIIPTYNRPMMVRTLVEILHLEAAISAVCPKLDIHVYDDGSDEAPVLHNAVVHRLRHRGKEGHWKTVNKMFDGCRDADHVLWLPDDITLEPGFFTRLWTTWCSISKRVPNLGALWPAVIEGRKLVRNWTKRDPKRVELDNGLFAIRLNWNDCMGLFHRRALETLGYELHPVSQRRFTKNPRRSSGVGQQISERLYHAGIEMYGVDRTLVHHGSHKSVMHPNHESRPMTEGFNRSLGDYKSQT